MPPSGHRTDPFHILVVEDDPDVLDLVCRTLRSAGHTVDGASGAEEALRLAHAGAHDLLIVDLMLPDADGVILQGRLNQVDPGLKDRTIFMTGFTSREPVVAYLKSLSAHFIQKPFGPAELLDAVNGVS